MLVVLVNFFGSIWLKIFGVFVAVVVLYEFFNLFRIERYMLYLSIVLSFFVIFSNYSINNKILFLFVFFFLFVFIESFKNRIVL